MKKSWFTLVEMLIVVVIIGILISALTTKIQWLQGRARDAWKKAELTDINTAVLLYYTDNSNYNVSWAGRMGWWQWRINLNLPPTYTISFFEYLKSKGYIENIRDYTIVEANGKKITKQTPPCSGSQMRDLYMYYTNGKKYSLSAYLETPSPEEINYIQNTYNWTWGNWTCTIYWRNFALGN